MAAPGPRLPFGPLRFLYVGTDDTARDAAWYVEKCGAVKHWHVKAMGAEVAALELGAGPWLLLADHRKAGSVLPIYEVDDLRASVSRLQKAGWKPEGDVFEVPNGPCRIFKDPSGNELCLLQDVRPHATEGFSKEPGE